MVIRRGDLHWAYVPQIDGTVQRRPVLVVQADGLNRSRMSTILTVPITSNTASSEYPGTVFLPASVSGLSRDSVAKVAEVQAVPRRAVVEQIGALPAYVVQDVDRGLRLVLGL